MITKADKVVMLVVNQTKYIGKLIEYMVMTESPTSTTNNELEDTVEAIPIMAQQGLGHAMVVLGNISHIGEFTGIKCILDKKSPLYQQYIQTISNISVASNLSNVRPIK